MATFKQLPVPNGGARREITGPFTLAQLQAHNAGEYKHELALVVEAGVPSIYTSNGSTWVQL